jgi:hypothetical protein
MEHDAFVYVIGSEDGPKKIGIAKSIQKRLGQIKCGSPNAVSILAERSMSRQVAFAVEHLVHAVLGKHRLSGEWFDVPSDIATATIDKAIMLVSEMMATHDTSNVRSNALCADTKEMEASISNGNMTLNDTIQSYSRHPKARRSVLHRGPSLREWLYAHKKEIEDAFRGRQIEWSVVLEHAAKEGLVVTPEAIRQSWFRIRHSQSQECDYGSVAKAGASVGAAAVASVPYVPEQSEPSPVRDPARSASRPEQPCSG